ncbi:MAG: MFS transporter, partial [Isosphaeraceae bacterium]|nr:MFS transporter [Isosphaeraceae bacterium]
MAGSLVSWVGDWMDLTTLNWAVLERTDSPLALGLINACRLVPSFVLSIPAGVLADRHDRRCLLTWLQAGGMVLTFGIGFLVASGSPFWLFAAAVTLRAILMAMVPPVRSALIPNLVPSEAIARAIAGQAALMNLARIVGPALAGALLALLEVEELFWINGWSFVAVLFTLILIRPGSDPEFVPRADARAGIREAVAYVRGSPSIQSLLILAVVPMIFGFPYTALMPLFARDLLQLGPEGFGALLSISAVGALSGSAWLALSRGVQGSGRWLVGSILGFGLSLLLFMAARGFAPAAPLMFAVGLTSQIYRTTSRITLQREVPDRLRGRILSLALMDRGLIPLGAILIGAVADGAGTG